MTNAFTRRALVAAAPAAVIAAALPAIASSALRDADLLALREPYERTLAAAEAVSPAHTRAEDACIAAKAAHPKLDRAALEKMTGLDVAEARWNEAIAVNSDVIQQIIDTPANTIEGLMFKAEICERECMNADLAESIVADLLEMGGHDA